MDMKTILLVEDDPNDIELVKKAWEKANVNAQLVIVEDGQKALDFLAAAGPETGRKSQQLPALVILDIKLPGIDGLSVLTHIRENPITHHQPVVILTTSKDSQDIKKGYDLGINSYIVKPVNFNQFVEVIQLLGRYWVSVNEFPINK